MKTRIMYVEPKGASQHVDHLTAKIGRVALSKSGKPIRYRDHEFAPLDPGRANYIDEHSGERYWISGCRRDGNDRIAPGVVEIDDDVREEYWTEIRMKPESVDQKSFRSTGRKDLR